MPCALQIADGLDEDLGDVVERFLQLREDEQDGKRVAFGRLEVNRCAYHRAAMFTAAYRSQLIGEQDQDVRVLLGRLVEKI